MPVDSEKLQKFYDEVENLETKFIDDRLAAAIRYQSVSSETEKRGDVVKMAEFLGRELGNLGVEVTPYKMGQQPGTNIELPPILVGWYPRKDEIKKDKKTLLIYGHYDVQPALTGWTRPVFELTREEKGLKSEKLYGRGSTDDKGPVLAWINAIEAHKKAGVEIPVNLIFCFEGMEESSSAGFPKFLEDHGERIFENVDGAVIADNYWITTEHPCLTYGLRGINYFRVTIEGAPKQLHSGIYGGAVAEPMTDLFSLFSKLVDNKGNILIPGINEQVEELTSAEEDLYKNIHFTREDFIEAVGNNRILYDNATHILMHRWRYPSLSIHGIHGADSSESPGTAIPNKVTGAFSTRTVPNMKSDDVNKAVKDYLNDEFEKLGSKCTIDIRVSPETTPFWRTNPNDRNFQAAAEATEKVYGSKPDYTREGGSIGVALYLQKILKDKSLLLLPVGASDDGPHGPNEKIDKRNYTGGTKLVGAYWHYFDHFAGR